MAPETRWTAYDDELGSARNQVNSQMRSAERAIAQAQEDISTVERYAIYLTGNYADAEGDDLLNAITLINDVLPIIEANNAATNQSLTLEDFFVGPQRVNVIVEDDDVLLNNSFDFRSLAETLAQDTSALRTPGSIRRSINFAERVYEIGTTDVGQYETKISEEQAKIQDLAPKKELLDSDSARDQVRGLSIWGDTTGDDIIGRLQAADEPSALTAQMREQVAAVSETVSPEAVRRTIAATVGSTEPEDEEPEPGVFAPRSFDFEAGASARPPTEDGRTMVGPQAAPSAPTSRPPTEDGRTAVGAVSQEDRPLLLSQYLESIDPDFFEDSETVSDGTTPAPTYTPGPTAAQIRDANQAEVELLLAQQFGGFSFFLQKHRSDLQVGLTADGQVVPADDPNAATVKNILDVIVDQGITAPTRVLGLLENTEWWQTTDARMREYDVLTADMSEPQKLEYLEPVLDNLRDEAQFLGFQLDPTRARDLAEQITRMGEEGDAEFIRGLLTAEEAFNAAEVTSSSFAAARDEIVAMSKRYFTPINEVDAAEFAQDIYVGTKTAEGVEQYFREMAGAKFPQLENSLNAGITPEQYFAPYKYEIERMLDRPNVDLYEEFGDVVQFIPDTGTGEARPMTLGEVRKYVRGLDEWQQSSQAKDSARALAFSIGKTFGEVA